MKTESQLPGITALDERIISDLMQKTGDDCAKALVRNIELIDSPLARQYAKYLYTMAVAARFLDFHVTVVAATRGDKTPFPDLLDRALGDIRELVLTHYNKRKQSND